MMFSAHQEDFLRRIAIRSGMQGKQFQEMLAVDGPDHVIQELSTLADEKGIEIPNIDSLYSSMTINSDIAQKAFKKWYPGERLFRGPILYLAARDRAFDTTFPGMMSDAEMWKAVLGEGVHVLECPGNHYSMITEPMSAKNIGQAIVTAATLSLKELRPYSCIRGRFTFSRKSKLSKLKQHGLTAGVFKWTEGLTSANAKIGTFTINEDETVLTFKEQNKYSLQRYFQVHVRDIVLLSRNTIPLDIVVRSSSQAMSVTYAVISMRMKHRHSEFVFFCREDLVTFVQALEVILKVSLPFV